MKRISDIFTILFSILLICSLRTEAQLPDSVTKTHYYDEEIFDSEYLDIYNSWELTEITGGLSGAGYEPDFDILEIDSFGIFRVYRNDSLFIYGKITVEEQTLDHLLVSSDADTISGGILFEDMEKYMQLDSDTLILEAPCCDRYTYLFTSESLNPIVYIPDTAFLHALIDEGVDTDGDSLVSYEEAAVVEELDISEKWIWGDYPPCSGNIFSLAGIEAFTNLKYLECTCNSPGSLDLSHNNNLEYLDCSFNSIHCHQIKWALHLLRAHYRYARSSQDLLYSLQGLYQRLFYLTRHACCSAEACS